MPFRFYLFLITLILAVPCLGTAATLWYVDDSNTTGPWMGSQQAPFQFIQEGIDAARGGDKVLVAQGTYLENIDFLGKAVHLKSLAGAHHTIIDGGSAGSVVTFAHNEGLDSILEGFSITNGTGTPDPPAGTAAGGGIFCKNASPLICSNLIFDNRVVDPGKGPSTGNTGVGAGIYCFESAAVILCNAIWNNYSDCKGGGVLVAHGDLILANNTICGNSADLLGGGLYVSSISTLWVMNTIFWDNTCPVAPEMIVRGSSVLTLDYSNVHDMQNTVIIAADSTLNLGPNMLDMNPAFVNQGQGDLHLSWLSPCINRGLDTATAQPDPDQNPRIHMGSVDLGAYEFVDTLALEADTFTLSQATGGQINFSLEGRISNKNRSYFLLGSLAKSNPGFPLPGGMVHLPLEWDSFTELAVVMANSSFMPGFHGILDGSGAASARLDSMGLLPPAMVGTTLNFAYLAYYPTYFPYDFVSNPVTIEIVP